MKNKIIQSLLLASMMVFLSASLNENSVAPVWAKENIQTDVAAQTETTNTDISNNLYAGVIKEIQPVKVEPQEAKATIEKREDVAITSREYVYENIEMISICAEIDKKMSELDDVADKKEWFIEYKEIIEEYSDALDPPESIYDYYTNEELDLLFRVVQAEIGDEYSFEQKCNVASVIFNRLNSDKDVFKSQDSLLKVLIPSQFSTISNGRYRRVEVSETTKLACEYIFMIENTMPNALFFDSDGSLNYKLIANDGAHNFYGLKGEQ